MNSSSQSLKAKINRSRLVTVQHLQALHTHDSGGFEKHYLKRGFSCEDKRKTLKTKREAVKRKQEVMKKMRKALKKRREALKKMRKYMIKARKSLEEGELNDAKWEENRAFTIGFHVGLASNGRFHAGTVDELSVEEWERGGNVPMKAPYLSF